MTTKPKRAETPEIRSLEDLHGKIYTIRGMQVMLDEDLAQLYGAPIGILNRAVKRNEARFPIEFCFQLTSEETEILRFQFGILRSNPGWGRHRKFLPHAYTEQGVAMLSSVLRSETAIQVSIQIMQAFVEMRRQLQATAGLFQRFEGLEKRQIAFEGITERQFGEVFAALEGSQLPQKGVFFDGQVYDAHAFVSDLIRSARKSILLLDNYVDDTVLTLLGKRATSASACILTPSVSKALALDLAKHNAQYAPIEVRSFASSHDRFLILDSKTVYHIGASLKDLGKKWFAFSRFEKEAAGILERLP